MSTKTIGDIMLAIPAVLLLAIFIKFLGWRDGIILTVILFIVGVWMLLAEFLATGVWPS